MFIFNKTNTIWNSFLQCRQWVGRIQNENVSPFTFDLLYKKNDLDIEKMSERHSPTHAVSAWHCVRMTYFHIFCLKWPHLFLCVHPPHLNQPTQICGCHVHTVVTPTHTSDRVLVTWWPYTNTFIQRLSDNLSNVYTRIIQKVILWNIIKNNLDKFSQFLLHVRMWP